MLFIAVAWAGPACAAAPAQDLQSLLEEFSGDEVACWRPCARALVEQLASPDAVGRDMAVEQLKKLDARRWSELVPYLAHPRLAMRSAAGGLLTRSTSSGLAFDPFAPAGVRAAQIAAWQDWMVAQGAPPPVLDFHSPFENPEGTADEDLPPPPPIAIPRVPQQKAAG